MAGTLTNIEASLMRYLYTNLTLAQGVKVFEDVYTQDFDNYTEWVVIDTLSGTLGVQPKQNFFIHVATHKGSPNAKDKLTRLFDTVVELLAEHTDIPLYDYDSEELIGSMYVVRPSSTPVVQHKGGGNMRTLSMSLIYQGE